MECGFWEENGSFIGSDSKVDNSCEKIDNEL